MAIHLDSVEKEQLLNYIENKATCLVGTCSNSLLWGDTDYLQVVDINLWHENPYFCSDFSTAEGTADSGMTINRVPGTLAGLKERSQSAYAVPIPKPVESAIGQVRLLKRITDATTPTLSPTPVFTIKSAKHLSYF